MPLHDDGLAGTILYLINVLENATENNCNKISEDHWAVLFRLLGEKVLQSRIKDDGVILSQSYKNTEDLCTLNAKDYLADRDTIVVAFLEGMSGLCFSDKHTGTVLFKIACTLESLYQIRNFNWIFPHSFAANLVQSVISSSKKVTKVNGKILPGGSSPTYFNWLKEQGSHQVACPSGDIETYFDNIGKYIVKSYRVSKNKNAVADIITTTLHIVLDTCSSLQMNASLMPVNWGCNLSKVEIQRRMEDLISSSKVTFRKIRLNYIAKMIDVYKSDKANVENRIESLLNLQNRYCVNAACAKKYPNLKRKCDDCGSLVTKPVCEDVVDRNQTDSSNEKYLHIERNNVNLKTMTVGESILLNPNSYNNIEQILDQLKVNLNVPIERNWAYVGCDGPPYCIASRICEENKKKYGWVSLIPGLGHLNMNQLKSLFKVLDHIFLQPLGKEVLNFKSTAAYNYFVCCKDNHKS